MSLAIDPDTITSILLADGWHEIEPASLALDAYEFVEHERLVYNGQRQGCAGGFAAIEIGAGADVTAGALLCGPMSSVLALRAARTGAGTSDNHPERTTSR